MGSDFLEGLNLRKGLRIALVTLVNFMVEKWVVQGLVCGEAGIRMSWYEDKMK